MPGSGSQGPRPEPGPATLLRDSSYLKERACEGPISLRSQSDSASHPCSIQFDVLSISLQWHFDHNLIQLRTHARFTSMLFRFHFDDTSITARFNFASMLDSLQNYFDVTSMTLRVHLDFAADSLPIPIEFTSDSPRGHFDVTTDRLPPINFDFMSIGFDATSISLPLHFRPTLIPLRFDCTVDGLQLHFNSTSISFPCHFDL